MCEPATLTMLAIAAVSATASYVQADKSAKVQEHNLEMDRNATIMALTRQADQQGQQGAAQANEHARKASADAALFDATAGEYGGGLTSDRMRGVATIRQSEDLATIQSNATQAAGEGSFRQVGANRQADAALASISRPSGLGTALQIAGAGASAYSQHTALEASKRPPARAS